MPDEDAAEPPPDTSASTESPKVEPPTHPSPTESVLGSGSPQPSQPHPQAPARPSPTAPERRGEPPPQQD